MVRVHWSHYFNAGQDPVRYGCDELKNILRIAAFHGWGMNIGYCDGDGHWTVSMTCHGGNVLHVRKCPDLAFARRALVAELRRLGHCDLGFATWDEEDPPAPEHLCGP